MALLRRAWGLDISLENPNGILSLSPELSEAILWEHESLRPSTPKGVAAILRWERRNPDGVEIYLFAVNPG